MPLAAFDLDGTLVDQALASRQFANEFTAAWDLPAQAADGLAVSLAERRPKGEVFDHVAASWSLPVTGAELWAMYRKRMPELVRCSEADRLALRDLRAAGWTVGIVSNGRTDNQEGKIRATGLDQIVDGWVVSEAVGHRKPDPRIFVALAAELDCALDGWMIGDSLADDIVGGAGVGLRTALVVASPPLLSDLRPRPTMTAPTVAAAVARILAGGDAPHRV